MPILLFLIIGGVGLAVWASNRATSPPQLPAPEPPPVADSTDLQSMSTIELVDLVGDTQRVITGSSEMAEVLTMLISGETFDPNSFQELYMAIIEYPITEDIQYEALNTFANAMSVLMTQRTDEIVKSPGITQNQEPAKEEKTTLTLNEQLEQVFGDSYTSVVDAINNSDSAAPEKYVAESYQKFQDNPNVYSAAIYTYLFDIFRNVNNSSPK